MKKLLTIICLLISLMVLFTGCGNKTGSENNGTGDSQDLPVENVSSEDFFEWDDNIIIALTEKGAKQKAIVIPEKCEGFDGMIFADVENSIEAVSFESDKDIDLNGVFGSAEKIKTISLPKNLSKIGSMDFCLCSSLETISIPANVTEIGSYAFQDNKSLKSIIFEGNITTIGAHSFDGCELLTDIVFPDTISQIEEYAFYNCISLKKISLPSSLTIVEEFSFGNTGIEEITIPKDVVLEKYDSTSFVQPDHNINVYVYSGSWIDQNFDTVFSGAYIKNYK